MNEPGDGDTRGHARGCGSGALVEVTERNLLLAHLQGKYNNDIVCEMRVTYMRRRRERELSSFAASPSHAKLTKESFEPCIRLVNSPVR